VRWEVAAVTISDVSRCVAPGGRAARRLLVTLLAVGALLLGILMMHSVANSQDGANAAANGFGSQALSGTAPMAAATALEHGSTVASIGCSGPCDDTHDSAIMACILALLTAGFVLVGSALGQSWTPPRDGLRRLLSRAGTFSLRLAPTLESLSISLT